MGLERCGKGDMGLIKKMHARLGERHDELAVSFECSKSIVLFLEREVKRREELVGIATLSGLCTGEIESWIRTVCLGH